MESSFAVGEHESSQLGGNSVGKDGLSDGDLVEFLNSPWSLSNKDLQAFRKNQLDHFSFFFFFFIIIV